MMNLKRNDIIMNIFSEKKYIVLDKKKYYTNIYNIKDLYTNKIQNHVYLSPLFYEKLTQKELRILKFKNILKN